MSRRVVRTKNRWTASQLELLVQTWEKYYPTLKAGRGNEHIYELMLQELTEGECLDASVKDVKNRISNLSNKFRKEVNQVIATGIPSQWALYNKIEKFFEYETPIHLKPVGPPAEYDMSEYLHMDIDLEQTIAMHQLVRVQPTQGLEPMGEYLMDENTLDVEELEELASLEEFKHVAELNAVAELKDVGAVDELLGDMNPKEILVPEQEQPVSEGCSQATPDLNKVSNTGEQPEADSANAVPDREYANAVPDREFATAEPERESANAVPEREPANAVPYHQSATVEPDRASSQSVREPVSEPEPEASGESGSSARLSTDSDSSFDFQAPVTPSSKPSQQSQIFHFNGSYRLTIMESFLSQLYSNQLYADVMLITCHEGVTCVMPAHRFVLANFSDFFSSILGALKPNSNGSPLTVLVQPDISQPVMQLLLQFMYTGKVSVTQELIGDFLRCGYLLRIRGVWSEEKGDDVKPAHYKLQPPVQPQTASEQCVMDQFDRSTVSLDQQSRTLEGSETDPSNSSLQESSDYTLKPHEKPRKRRKKPFKRVKRKRFSNSDDEGMENVEVSSNVGLDLLRSDTEADDVNRTEEPKDKPLVEDVAQEVMEVENVAVDVTIVNDHEVHAVGDVDEHGDEDGLQIVEDGEHKDIIIYDGGEEQEENVIVEDKTLYMVTGDESIETDIEESIVNVNMVSNPSTITTTIPEPLAEPPPPPESAPEPTPETISESEKVHNNERTNIQPLNTNDSNVRDGNESLKIEEHESTAANTKKEELEQAPTAPPEGPPPDAQQPTHSVEVKRALASKPAEPFVQPLSPPKPVKRVFPPRRHSLPPMQYFQFAAYWKAKQAEGTSAKQALPTARPWYGCRICGKRFTLSDRWLEHVVYEHASDEQLMKGEKNPEERVTMLRCDLCSKYLDTKYEWIQHIVMKHTERYPHLHAELPKPAK